ncbi:MAG: rRNA maturation RNase YbeY [Gemmatimonadaceae bacterium]
MSVVVDVAVDAVRLGVPRALVVRAATAALRSQRAGRAVLSITFESDRRMAAHNRRHLGRRGTTDVIAFGFEPVGPAAPRVGDIYIAPETARRSARVRGLAARDEMVRLVVHGTLHVLGFDHPEDESRVASPMWQLQERLVKRMMRAGAR